MKAHPAADMFPLMDEAGLDALAKDIRENGQRNPIVLHEGAILDGRNRYRACELAGVDPKTVEWDGAGSPWRFTWSLNGQRRNLPAEHYVALRIKSRMADAAWWEEQAAKRGEANEARSEAAKAQPRAHGGKFESTGPVSCDTGPVGASEHSRLRDGLAAETGVSPATAGRVLALSNARPDLFEQIAGGIMTCTEAARIAKRERVAESCPLPTGKYRVIYADPPWKYNDTRAGLAGYSGTAAEDHYPTMSVAELSALDVASLAEDDAVLFCWATFPLLDDALAVVKAWGFTYKTAFVWAKERANLGNYHDAGAELLLVATRGSCLPDAEKRECQVQQCRRTGRHSEKPEHFRELVDRLYTKGSRIELFRRGAAPAGWKVWGNEAVVE